MPQMKQFKVWDTRTMAYLDNIAYTSPPTNLSCYDHILVFYGNWER